MIEVNNMNYGKYLYVCFTKETISRRVGIKGTQVLILIYELHSDLTKIFMNL